MAAEFVRLTPASPPQPSGRQRTVLVCALLALGVLAIYAPVFYYDFLNYDDGAYVIQNPEVQAGLTTKGLIWALVNLLGEHNCWHPLTWVSHMRDCQLFGLSPVLPHLVNPLSHAANTFLLLLVLKRMTGALGRNTLAAALFAVHPLQVDTVGWISERKNLLSSLLWLLTIWAYVRYAAVQLQRGGVKSQEGAGSGFWACWCP
jgi:hypothetical protein